MIDSRILICLPFVVFAAILYVLSSAFKISIVWFVGYSILAIPNLIILLSSQKDKSKEEVDAYFAKADFSHLVKFK